MLRLVVLSRSNAWCCVLSYYKYKNTISTKSLRIEITQEKITFVCGISSPITGAMFMVEVSLRLKEEKLQGHESFSRSLLYLFPPLLVIMWYAGFCKSAILYYKHTILYYKRTTLYYKRSTLYYNRTRLYYKRKVLYYKRTTLYCKCTTLYCKRSILPNDVIKWVRIIYIGVFCFRLACDVINQSM